MITISYRYYNMFAIFSLYFNRAQVLCQKKVIICESNLCFVKNTNCTVNTKERTKRNLQFHYPGITIINLR